MTTAGHLWLDPSFGASGDMFLGALTGLFGSSAPLRQLEGLPIEGFSIHESIESRGGLESHRVRVEVTSDDTAHRSWSTIDRMLEAADVPGAARRGARRTFRLLAEVEAAQHGVPIDEVHFHEVGAIDAIVDIVGAWLFLAALEPRSVTAGPVGIGHGTVEAGHGRLPLPAPATAALLRGRPVRALDTDGETCTPTGAALLVSMAEVWGPMPSGVLRSTVRGAGGRNPATHPNVLSAHLIEAATGTASTSITVEPAVVVSTNVDDVTAEDLGHLIDLLLDAGADDAWIIPISMKKSRPAHEVRVLTTLGRAADMRDQIMRHTGTLGCRVEQVAKHVADRRFETITIDGHDVSIKVGPHGAKPEFDDLVAVARRTGSSLSSVRAAALAAWRGRDETTDPPT